MRDVVEGEGLDLRLWGKALVTIDRGELRRISTAQKRVPPTLRIVIHAET